MSQYFKKNIKNSKKTLDRHYKDQIVQSQFKCLHQTYQTQIVAVVRVIATVCCHFDGKNFDETVTNFSKNLFIVRPFLLMCSFYNFY